MKKGRSNYNFQFNCDVNTVNQVIQSYMSANGFVPVEKKGEKYYKAGDAMMGYKYFNYSIDGNNLTVYAWLKGVAGEICLEQDGLATMNAMVMSYRNSLDVLFQEISKLNTVDSNQNITGYDSDTAQTISGNSQSTNNTDVFLDKFQDETTKKKENMCEIGFWLSIIGLLLPFFGLSFGYIVYALDFYFAAQGLKTRKKRKAIATFVISIISIVLVIINLLC